MAETPDLQSSTPTAFAIFLRDKTDAHGFPTAGSWALSDPILFDRDWRGENADPLRSTEVRLLWTFDTLFLRFLQRYRTITIFADARTDGWRDGLWDRDVAEAFLQPDAIDPLRYKEFEVSPNGFWIDLDISHGQKQELHSKLLRRVVCESREKTWTAELAIPMGSLTSEVRRGETWRANFYRVEGDREPRFYSAWSPTHSSKPNFHVPSAFGSLIFR